MTTLLTSSTRALAAVPPGHDLGSLCGLGRVADVEGDPPNEPAGRPVVPTEAEADPQDCSPHLRAERRWPCVLSRGAGPP
jgi:hypothetical protein